MRIARALALRTLRLWLGAGPLGFLCIAKGGEARAWRVFPKHGGRRCPSATLCSLVRRRHIAVAIMHQLSSLPSVHVSGHMTYFHEPPHAALSLQLCGTTSAITVTGTHGFLCCCSAFGHTERAVQQGAVAAAADHHLRQQPAGVLVHLAQPGAVHHCCSLLGHTAEHGAHFVALPSFPKPIELQSAPPPQDLFLRIL